MRFDLLNFYYNEKMKFYLSILLFLTILLSGSYYFHNSLKAEAKGSLMIVIENHPRARPQAGLNQADIVYEFLVEGGITRFLAGYFTSMPDKAGPIRSLRPYMVEVADQHSSPIFHIGASSDALRKAAEHDLLTIDEIANQEYYWRDEERSRPHNLYTSSSSLENAFSEQITGNPNDNKKETEDFRASDYLNTSEQESSKFWQEREKANKVSLQYWGNMIEYVYSEQQGRYKRYLEDSPHILEDEETIKVKSLIVIYTSHEIIDDQGRLNINFSNSGRAAFFSQGRLIEGKWQNQRQNGNLKFTFFADDREEITFPPGSTWVHIVPETASVNIDN